MDIKNMPEFYNGQFDCIIDKATLDTLYVFIYLFVFTNKCSDNANESVNTALSEIYRVLGPKGVYICISHSQPEYRLPWLENVKKIIQVNVQLEGAVVSRK